MKAKRAAKGTLIRTFSQLVLVETDDCVLWPHGRSTNGYGKMGHSGRVHVLACIQHNGQRPADKTMVAHSCRNRHCMNYRHLRWATAAENQADKVRDGTSTRGTRQHCAKLTERDVHIIRFLTRRGVPQRAVAAEFGVSNGLIHSIASRAAWAWLPDVPMSHDLPMTAAEYRKVMGDPAARKNWLRLIHLNIKIDDPSELAAAS